MKIAIVGSRKYPDMEEVVKFVNSLPEGTIVVSGGAQGVDSWAEMAARSRDLEVIVHKADWKKHGKSAGVMRNKLIEQDADSCVAFWDGISRGTAYTIEFFKQAKKPVEVRTSKFS